MKQSNEVKRTKEINAVAAFWACLLPAAAFGMMAIIHHQYAVIISVVIWFIPATIYVVYNQTKRKNAKDFLKYSAMAIMFFTFIVMIVLTAIAIG